jgi:tetratricopeptide (TPR) repeat protein
MRADRLNMLRMNSLKNSVSISLAVMAIVSVALPAGAAPQPRKAKTAEVAGISGEARELRDKGVVELNLGRYDDAVKLLERAYELSRDPAILFDLVQAHRLIGNPERALVLCASFLRTAPALTPRNREQIERTVSELNIIVEQISLQGKGGRTMPAPRAVAKEKALAVEPPAASATEPPAVAAVEPAPEKEPESKVAAAGPLPSSAAKDTGIERSAELLKSEPVPVETGPRTPFYRSPWLWTAVGLAVSGVAAYVVYQTAKDPGPPSTSWGAVRAF